jgi:hypothetical protein
LLCKTLRQKYPLPWRIEEGVGFYAVIDGLGKALAYVYFGEAPSQRDRTRRYPKDEAWQLARALMGAAVLLRD